MSKSKPFHGTISNHSSMVASFFAEDMSFRKNTRQYLQHFSPLQRLSCVSCRALRKSPSYLSGCFIIHLLAYNPGACSSLSYVYHYWLFCSWPEISHFVPSIKGMVTIRIYTQMRVYMDTFLLFNILIPAMSVQIYLLDGAGFVQLARSALKGEGRGIIFLSCCCCWILCF